MKSCQLSVIAVILLQCCSSITAIAQKSFTTKGIKPYIMLIYSINKMGVEKEPIFDIHDLNGVNQSKVPSGDKTTTIPATVSVNNNINFAAGVDYDMWLPKRFFFTVGAEFRTLNNDVRYDYDFNRYIKGAQFEAPFDDNFNYKQRLNLLSFGLHFGKNFTISNNEFEVRVGASIPFNLNEIEDYKSIRLAYLVEQNGSRYLLPYTYQEVHDFNRERSFISENPRLHIYLGTNKKLNIFSKKPTNISYGLQLNFVDGQDRHLRFYSSYDYSMDGSNIYYKSQRTTFSYTKVMEIGLKVGLTF